METVFKNNNQLFLACALSFLIAFFIGLYLYYEWLLATIIIGFILLSGGIAIPFVKQSKPKWLFVGAPIFGFLSSTIFGFTVLNDVHKTDGHTLEQKAEEGDHDAQYSKFLLSLFTHKEQEKSTKQLLSSAEEGHVKSQYMLGLMLARSKDERLLTHGYKWLRIAENKGHEDAAEALTKFYSNLTNEQKAQGEKMFDEWLMHHENSLNK